MNIYHVTTHSAWIDATRQGAYTADSLKAEGFIHCSTAAQVMPVLREYFRGQTGLVLLVIDPDRLRAPLRWEQSAPPPGVEQSAAFPHVYGPIELDAITACLELTTNEAGEFVLPPPPAKGGSEVLT